MQEIRLYYLNELKTVITETGSIEMKVLFNLFVDAVYSYNKRVYRKQKKKYYIDSKYINQLKFKIDEK